MEKNSKRAVVRPGYHSLTQGEIDFSSTWIVPQTFTRYKVTMSHIK